MALQLWIPRSAQEKRKVLRCEIPGCGKTFPLDQRQQFDRHVKACLRQNIDVLQAHADRRDRDHGLQDFDLELQAYLKRTRRLPSEA